MKKPLKLFFHSKNSFSPMLFRAGIVFNVDFAQKLRARMGTKAKSLIVRRLAAFFECASRYSNCLHDKRRSRAQRLFSSSWDLNKSIEWLMKVWKPFASDTIWWIFFRHRQQRGCWKVSARNGTFMWKYFCYKIARRKFGDVESRPTLCYHEFHRIWFTATFRQAWKNVEHKKC